VGIFFFTSIFFYKTVHNHPLNTGGLNSHLLSLLFTGISSPILCQMSVAHPSQVPTPKCVDWDKTEIPASHAQTTRRFIESFSLQQIFSVWLYKIDKYSYSYTIQQTMSHCMG